MDTRKSRLANERRQALNTIGPFDWFNGYNEGYKIGVVEGSNKGFLEGYEAGFNAALKIAKTAPTPAK
jgi:hypothetical protein